MLCNRISTFAIGAMALGLLGGCAESKQDMANMKPPERPAELAKLACLLGEWEAEMEMRMPGMPEAMKAKGRNRVEWAADGWVLLEHFEMDMGEGQTSKGLGLWTWDAKEGEFINAWMDSSGSIMHGTAVFSADGKSMEMEGHGWSGMMGKNTYGEGTVHFVDDKTMKWDYKEWDNMFKWGAAIEMTGTSRKE